MGRTIRVEIVGDADDLAKTFGRAGKETEGFGKKVSRAAGVAGAAIAGGLLLLGKKSADAASSLNESMNAVNVVFGKSADKIAAFSRRAATEAGLSARAFNELVTPIGAALQNVGFGADEAATASINLAKRAADMASVFNVDVSEALEAIQAGLRGEADPLERFGVGLSDAAVTAKALEMGLSKTADALGPNEKAQARLALLMEQTNRVAGDFKNTSDELANSQRINAAEAENQSARFGQALLPAMEMFQGILRSTLGFLAEHQTLTQGLAIALGALAAALLTASVASTLLNLSLLANPIGLVVLAVAGLVAGLIVAYNKFETVRTVADFLRDHWQLLLLAFGVLPFVIAKIVQHFGTLRGIAVGVFNKIKGVVVAVKDAIGFVIDKVRALWGWLKDKLANPAVRAQIENTLLGPFRTIRDVIQGVINKVQDLIDWIARIDFPDFPNLNPLDHLAGGTRNFRGGMAVVGERGPEIVNLPRGSDVIPNHRLSSARPSTAAGVRGEVRVIVVGGDRAAIQWLDQALMSASRSGWTGRGFQAAGG